MSATIWDVTCADCGDLLGRDRSACPRPLIRCVPCDDIGQGAGDDEAAGEPT